MTVQGRGLPNECLHMVVNHLHKDLATLHTLLLTSRFFFNAALPLIWDDPTTKWQMDFRHGSYKADRKKFMTTLLACLLHHRGQAADEVLAGFGLQLNSNLSDYPLLEDVALGKSKMTLDYSTLLTRVRPDEWPYFRYESFIRLLRLPKSLMADGEEEAHPHTLGQQISEDYRLQVGLSISSMLLEFNMKHVKHIYFDMALAQDIFLPRASHMANLAILHISRRRSLPDIHIQATAAFIRRNQDAFPSKARLELEFHAGWTNFDLEPFMSQLPDETEAQRMSRMRQAMVQFARPKLSLYEAVGMPSAMYVSNFPGFYTRVAQCEIGLERLISFYNSEDDHMDSEEEADAMRLFLERCTALRDLDLRIGKPDVFAWAASRRRYPQLRSSPQVVLGALERLSMTSVRSYHYLLYAMNDAVVAFRDTLHTIQATGYLSSPSDPNLSHWITHENSLQANSFGNFAHQLPHLTTIHIDFQFLPCLRYVGSFSQCPALENLRIEFGAVQYDTHGRQNRPRMLLDPEADELVFSLFPKWNMPRLKSLELFGVAALRFDYESLESMSRLERLDLICDLWTSMDRDFWRIPRLSAHLASWDLAADDKDLTAMLRSYGFGHGTGSGNGGCTSSGTRMPADEHRRKWTKTWMLPHLRRLNLQGPHVCVFDFSWLDGSPLLQELSLYLKGAPQPLPFVDPSGALDNDHAIQALRLKDLAISGWKMSSSDISRLLKVGGPQLEHLFIRKPSRTSTLTGSQIVQSIHDRDSYYRLGDTAALSLIRLECEFSINKEESTLLGLTAVPVIEVFGLYEKSGRRIYNTSSGYFVREEDVLQI